VPRVGLLWHLVVLPILLWSPELWRLGCWGLAVVALVGLEVAERVGRQDKRFRLSSLAIFLVIGMVQSEIIIVTGGTHSPFVLIFPPSAIVLTYLLGKRATALNGYLAILVVVLTAAEVTGSAPWLAPPELLASARSDLSLVVQAMVVVVAMTMGTVFIRILMKRDHHRAQLLLAAEQRAAEASKARQQGFQTMAGSLAHELKNPMTTVTSITSYMQRKSQAGSRERAQLDLVVAELDRVRERLDALLNLSRPLAQVTVDHTDLGALAKDAVVRHAQLAFEHGVTLSGPPGSAEVVCDARKVAQVIDNVLQNAIEASPSGARVALALASEPDGVQLSVLDEGPGIDSQLSDQLFTAGVTSKDTGSGLGLAISAAIVHQHGGTITLKNRQGGGCAASIWLPVRQGGSP